MQRSQRRIVIGTAAAAALFAGGVLVALSVGGRARGDVRASEPLWTEKRDATPIDPGRATGFQKLAKEISAAVVNISTVRSAKNPLRSFHRNMPFFEFYEKFFGEIPKHFRNRGVGTGFVIHPKGYILTNHHVVEKSDEIKVKFSDDREFSARVVGSDAKTDLALIKIDTTQDLPVAPLGDSDRLEVGEWVVAIGNPFGLHHTVTAGIVSAKGRRGIAPGGRDLPYADFIQTDASINPGNSGGPLINLRGEVVGINTAINAAGQGIGFAIPVNMAKVLIPQLKERGRVERSWIGIHIQPVTPALAQSFGLGQPRGALVAEVVPGAPADKAGVQAGDVILEFNGQPIRRYSDLPWLASTAGVGTQVKMKALRRGQEIDFTLVLAEHPDARADGRGSGPAFSGGRAQGLGLTVTDVDSRIQAKLGLDSREGAVVTEVQDGSEAAKAGVQPNDVILQLNFKPVRNAAELERLISGLKSGDAVSFYLRRDKSHLWVALIKK
jgi:serine protease Do